MRYFMLAASLAAVLAMPAIAQPPEREDGGERPRDRQEARENLKKRLLNAFDKDGDGELSEEEKKQIPDEARARLRRLMAGEGERGAEGRRERAEGEKRDWPDRDADRRDPRRPGMHGEDAAARDELRKLIIGALFEKFDADKDEKLSREEFQNLARFVHRLHAHRGPGGPGPGFHGGNHGGPPRGGERFGPPGRRFDGPPGGRPAWRERDDRRHEGEGPRRPPRPGRPPGPESEDRDAV